MHACDSCSHKFTIAGEKRVAIDCNDVTIYLRAPLLPLRAHGSRRRLPQSMRITIIKRPHCTINEIDFTGWRVGETYEVPVELASLLIVEGCARLEVRTGEDRRRVKRWGGNDRRHLRYGPGGGHD